MNSLEIEILKIRGEVLSDELMGKEVVCTTSGENETSLRYFDYQTIWGFSSGDFSIGYLVECIGESKSPYTKEEKVYKILVEGGRYCYVREKGFKVKKDE